MRTFIIYIGIFALLGTTSCGTYHYSGDRTGSNWSSKEIRLAEKEMTKAVDIVKPILKDNTKAYLDCCLYKIMRKYNSFLAANLDAEGCEALASQCMSSFE